MKGKIEHGQLVTVEPLCERQLVVGDIVLYKVNKGIYLHLIIDIRENKYLIGNNRGRINGWTDTVYGICTKVED